MEKPNFEEARSAAVFARSGSGMYRSMFLEEPKLPQIPEKTGSSVVFVQEVAQRTRIEGALVFFLWTASMRKSKREDEFWVPAVCMSAAVLLKNGSPCMNAVQLLNTIILYHTGIIVSAEFSDIITEAIY